MGYELDVHLFRAYCHCGLGTFYSQTGQADKAHAELSAAIAMYREMAMNFWLPESEAALSEVGGEA